MMIESKSQKQLRRRPTALELAREKAEARAWIERLRVMVCDCQAKSRTTRTASQRERFEYLAERAEAKIEELQAELVILCGRNPTIRVRGGYADVDAEEY